MASTSELPQSSEGASTSLTSGSENAHSLPLAQDGAITSFGQYMAVKTAKLMRQVHDGVQPKSTIFQGISIYVNGHTSPPALTLRQLVVEHGGEYHHYYTRRGTSHIIASNLSRSRWNALRGGEKVIRPEWIVESIREGKLLPSSQFSLVPILPPTQQTLKMTKSSVGKITVVSLPERVPSLPTSPQRGRKRKKFEGLRPLKTRKLGELPNLNAPSQLVAQIGTVEIYGYMGNPRLKLGGLVFSLAQQPTEERVKELMRLFMVQLDDFNFAHVSMLLNRLERVTLANARTHHLWLEAVIELKAAVNQRCERKIGAKLFHS